MLAFKSDENLLPEEKLDEKSRNQLSANLLQLKKEGDLILQKIKRYRTDFLRVQTKKSLEELTGLGNVVEKLFRMQRKNLFH